MQGYVLNAEVILIARVVALSRRQILDYLGKPVREHIALVIERSALASICVGRSERVGVASSASECVHRKADLKVNIDIVPIR